MIHVIQIIRGCFAGACLSEDCETFTFQSPDWATFDSAIEAELIAQRVPYPVRVQSIGVAQAESLQPVESK